MSEIEEVSGAIVGTLFKAAYNIGSALYSGGMHFHNSGRGNEYLYAVCGGNMGA